MGGLSQVRPSALTGEPQAMCSFDVRVVFEPQLYHRPLDLRQTGPFITPLTFQTLFYHIAAGGAYFTLALPTDPDLLVSMPTLERCGEGGSREDVREEPVSGVPACLYQMRPAARLPYMLIRSVIRTSVRVVQLRRRTRPVTWMATTGGRASH